MMFDMVNVTKMLDLSSSLQIKSPRLPGAWIAMFQARLRQLDRLSLGSYGEAEPWIHGISGNIQGEKPGGKPGFSVLL